MDTLIHFECQILPIWLIFWKKNHKNQVFTPNYGLNRYTLIGKKYLKINTHYSLLIYETFFGIGKKKHQITPVRKTVKQYGLHGHQSLHKHPYILIQVLHLSNDSITCIPWNNISRKYWHIHLTGGNCKCNYTPSGLLTWLIKTLASSDNPPRKQDCTVW